MKNKVKKILPIILAVMLIVSAFNTIKVIAENKTFKLESVTIDEKSNSDVLATIEDYEDSEINTDITFFAIGDYTTLKLVIKNNTNNDYTIETITDNNTNKYITYQYDKHENEIFKAGSKLELPVKITYQAGADIKSRNQSFQVKLTFKLLSEDGKQEEVVPITGDNLTMHVIMLIISLIGLAFAGILYHKRVRTSLIVLVLFVPLFIKAATTSVVININNNIKLMDKVVVTYIVDGKKEEKIINYNSKLTSNDVNKDGYQFSGWYQNGKLFDFNNPVKEDITLDANFEIINYSITYDLDGGVASNPTKYTVEDEITLKNPTKTDYNFTGWTGSNGDTQQTRVTIDKGTTGNLNYKAHYSPIPNVKYTVTHKYKNLDGSFVTEVENLEGQPNKTVKPQTKSKTGFVNPELKELLIKEDGTSNLDYVYEREKYQLTLKDSEFIETTTGTGKYPYETPITVTAKDRTGYTFTRWSNNDINKTISFEMVEDTTLQPIYTKNSYNLSYEYYDDSDNKTVTLPSSSSVLYDDSVIVSDGLNLAGYTFDGWYKDSEKATSFNMPAGNVTLKGRLTANTNTAYKIEHYWQNIDNNNFTLHETENKTGTTDTEATATNKTYTGFTFDSTNTNNKLSGNIDGNGNLTLKLYYTRNSHEVTYRYTGNIPTNAPAVPTPATYKYSKNVSVANAPTLAGYTFSGWSRTGNFDMPDSDVEITGSFTPNTNTAYKIEHYWQNIDNNNFTLHETENKTGTTDTEATATNKTYTGFTFDSTNTNNKLSGNIDGNGNLTLKLYYTRNSHSVTYSYIGNIPTNAPAVPTPATYKYGKTVNIASAPTLAGYTFSGWSRTGNFDMPDSDVEITGSFTPNTNTAYKIEHYRQNLDDNNFTLFETENKTGTTDTEATATAKTYTGFTFDSTNTNNKLSGNIDGSGNLTLKLYYTRNSHSVTYSYIGDIPTNAPAVPTPATYKYGKTVNISSAPTLAGYTFSGWSRTSSFTMPDSDVEITGSFTANGDTPYHIEHYQQNLDNNNFTLYETEDKTGQTDTTATANPNDYTGFTFDSTNANNEVSGNIDGSGNLTLKLYYTRNSHEVTYRYTGNVPTNAPAVPTSATYKYGKTVNIASAPTLAGYTFSGWSRTSSFTMPDSDVEITGSFTANTNTAYKIEHYWQNIDNDNFTLHETENKTGTTDTEATATAKTYAGFTFDSSNTNNVVSGNIDGNGNLTLKLYYTRNVHSVTYSYTDDDVPYGATQIPGVAYYRYGKTVTVANKATATGYDFDGWYKNGEITTSFEMPDDNVEITGSFTPRNDTAYKIEHYRENLDNNNYTLYETDDKTGTTKAYVETLPKNYEGFTYYAEHPDTVWNGYIQPDGSLTLKLYYKRNVYGVTYSYTGNVPLTASELPQYDEYKHGATVTVAPNATAPGYTFSGWSIANPDVDIAINNNQFVIDRNISIAGSFTANTNTAYKVEHYWQNLDNNNFTLHETENKTGTTDTWVTATPNTYTGFTFDSENENNLVSDYIDGNGNLVLMLYYTRNSHSVTYQYTGEVPTGASSLPDTVTYKYGKTVTVANKATAQGYEFDGWYKDSTITTSFEMPDENVTLTGSFSLGESDYIVEHYVENLDGTYTVYQTDNETGPTMGTATAVATTIPNHQYDENNANNVKTGTIDPDHPLVLKLYYNLNVYTIKFNSTDGNTYNGDEVITDIIITKKHGQTLELNELPTKPTYTATLKQNEGISVNKKHNSLLGWYTEETTGTIIDSPVVITENKEYFAHWEDVPLMCKKATTLHTEECQRTSGGCYTNGYYDTGKMNTTTIVYGETSGSTTPKIGDAYDCDINNDQIYDANTERFYYIGDDGNGNAKLIYFSNWNGEEVNTTHNYTYGDAINLIPNGNHTQWFNLDTEARFLTKTEVQSNDLCGNANNIKNCEYILEKSSFQLNVDPLPENEKPYRSGIWLHDEGETNWRIQCSTLQITTSTTKNAVKPVITVPVSAMENTTLSSYTITFNAVHGNFGTAGVDTQDVTLPAGSALRTLPTPTKSGSHFDGWYTTTSYENKVTLPIIVTANKTYYAKWINDSGQAARIGDAEYTTLQAAIDAAPTDGTKTTIVVLRNIDDEALTVSGNRNVSIDLNNHVISNKLNNSRIFTVNSGNTLELFNGELSSDSSEPMIYVDDATFSTNGVTYNATGSNGVIYNDGGTVTISTNSNLNSTSSTNPTIYNSGTFTIEEGISTIKSTGTYAIYNESGDMKIGAIGHLSDTDPVIQGETYGIVSKVDYKFYDGVVKGKTYPIGIATGDTPTITSDTEKTKIIDQDTQVIYVHTSEMQYTDIYNIMYLKYWDNVFVVTFDNGEGIPSSDTIIVNRGSALGVLPNAPTRSGYHFRGWYKTTAYNEEDKITTSTVPTAQIDDPTDHNTAFVTYYARWVVDTGETHDVTFHTEGGTQVTPNPYEVNDGSSISEIPTSTRQGYVLDGWYTGQNGTGDKLELTTVFDDDAEYYANWVEAEACIGDTCYLTLEEAITAVPTTGVKTNIVLYKDITLTSGNGRKFTIPASNRNVAIDLNGHTISRTSNATQVFEVNNGATLELSNGTVTSTQKSGMINVNAGGTLNIVSGTYNALGTGANGRQAIYVDGGTVNISGGTISAKATERAAVHIPPDHDGIGNGSIYITGGTITSTGFVAVYMDDNAGSTLVIGEKDGTIDTTTPIIQGETYGVLTRSSYKFYDGTIKGKTYSIGVTTNGGNTPTISNDTTHSKINDIETDSDYYHDTDNGYETLYLVAQPTGYKITFNVNGGTGTMADVTDLTGTYTLPACTFTPPEGKQFKGWSLTTDGEIITSVEMTEDKIVYAIWEDIPVVTYTLSFNANGGTGTMSDVTDLTGTYTLPGNEFTAPNGKQFKGWSLTTSGEIITTVEMTQDRTVYAIWEDETYTISFNANGGTGTMSDVTDLTGTYTLPENEFTAPNDKRFKGWSLTTDGEIITTVEMTEDKIVYAIWEDIPMICHVVTDTNDLSKEACNSASDKGCKKAGITGTITYGHIYNGTSLDAGTAVDCKLTKAGSTYDRFYYLTTENGNAVLLSHSILSLASPGTLMSNTEQINFAGALNSLPTSSQWDNIPVTFTIDNEQKAARLATVEEIRTACGLGSGTTSSTGSLDSCAYVLASTGYAGNTGRSAYWIDKHDTTYLRVRGDTRLIGGTDTSGSNANENSKNSVKAVIEVPISKIELSTSNKVTITYNAGDGTVTPSSEEYDFGTAIFDLPTPTYPNHIFDGWYDNNDNLVTSFVLVADTTIYAHYADIDTSNITINVDGTHNIFNTAPNDISDYSIVSNDTSIATVSNGVITGVSNGTTTVTITNTTNNQSLTLNLEVTGITKSYTTSQAVTEYFEDVASWETTFANDGNQTTFINNIKEKFDTYNCSYCTSTYNNQNANSCSTYSNGTLCDQPVGYDTGVNGSVNVYTDNTKTTPVTYTTSTDGTIYNMIPGETYYWEDANDISVNGTVEAVGERRLIKSSVRNLRDLGGMAVSYTDGTGTKTGTLKYEKLYRGAEITTASGVTELEKLGIDREIDLRGSEGNQSYKLNKYDIGTKDSYTDIVVVNYHINPEPTYYMPTENASATGVSVTHQCGKNHLDEYRKMKAAIKQVMQDIIDGESIFFHCTIGTDRTGTLAYFLEGLLGVSEMDRLRDYELSYYFGLMNRSRFHDQYGSSINPRFYSMYRSYPTNEDIYAWYTYERASDDDTLLAQFRQAMINYN